MVNNQQDRIKLLGGGGAFDWVRHTYPSTEMSLFTIRVRFGCFM